MVLNDVIGRLRVIAERATKVSTSCTIADLTDVADQLRNHGLDNWPMVKDETSPKDMLPVLDPISLAVATSVIEAFTNKVAKITQELRDTFEQRPDLLDYLGLDERASVKLQVEIPSTMQRPKTTPAAD